MTKKPAPKKAPKSSARRSPGAPRAKRRAGSRPAAAGRGAGAPPALLLANPLGHLLLSGARLGEQPPAARRAKPRGRPGKK